MLKKVLFFLFLFVFINIFAEDLLLDILFTNDVHGGIDRYPATFMNPTYPPELGGGASAATYIKEVRKLSDHKTRDNILADQGDFFQGHPVGSVFVGKSVIKYMNMIGYDWTVVGNHEFDFGEDKLKAAYKLAKFPVLSCNLVKKGTNELVDYVKPYIIIKRLGLKIAVIGLTTTDTKDMSFPDNIKNVDFLPEKEALEKYVKIVRSKGVDLVFVAAHAGIPYDPEPKYKTRYLNDKGVKPPQYMGMDAQELAHEVEGIDVILGGHIHKGFSKPWEDPVTHTLVLQDYAYGSSIGHIILKIDKKTKKISGYELPAIKEGQMVTLFESEFLPDPEISDTILAMTKKAEKGMDEVIGESTTEISKVTKGAQSKIGNLVCDAMRIATKSDFSFINLGGVRAGLPYGAITYRDVFNVMPFDNQVVVLKIPGEVLRKIIETRIVGRRHGVIISGGEIVINKKRKDFDKITKFLVGGKPWDPNKIYRVATTDFLLQGNAGLTLLTKIPESQIERTGSSLRGILVEYIKNHSPISIELDNRWKRDDKSKLTKEMKEALSKK